MHSETDLKHPKQILMECSTPSFESLFVGQHIPVPEQHKQDFVKSEHGYFCYVQHDHFRDSPTHGKLLVRDTQYSGAMKAFARGYDPKNPPTHLKVLRLSKSRKSIITIPIHKKS